ncbi:MAG TPA: DinB family protein [Cyclobacteriaceae bacterium]|nr:DinB family protein [Cyclobacteriaceae bacterium]
MEPEKIIEFSRAIRQSTIKRLELIPAGFENWAISENALTISEIADHLIEADHWLISKLSDTSLKSFKAAKGKIHVSNREEYIQLIEELKNCLLEKNNFLNDLSEEKLNERIPDERFGGLVTRWWIIVRGNLDHEIHHRGQLSAYVRVLQDKGIIF